MAEGKDSPKAAKATGHTKYKAVSDLSYGDKTVKAGEVVSDIPDESVSWLLRDGHIVKEGK